MFSHRGIDDGTRLLVENMEGGEKRNTLDLGCGYGAVGITMAKLWPESKVWFVDRDMVAVDLARRNCELNGVKNVEFRLSNGFEQLEGALFDLIAANLPTHASNEMLEWMIRDTKNFLRKNGKLYVVTVSNMKNFIKKTFDKEFGNYAEVEINKSHTVSLAVNKFGVL